MSNNNVNLSLDNMSGRGRMVMNGRGEEFAAETRVQRMAGRGKPSRMGDVSRVGALGATRSLIVTYDEGDREAFFSDAVDNLTLPE